MWQVPYVRDTFDEDNDSSEEESDEDDQMMRMVQSLISKRKGNDLNEDFAKGIEWFVAKEKEMLKEARDKKKDEEDSGDEDIERHWVSEPRIDK